MARTVERRQLGDEVADHIRARILTGELTTGDSVKVEHVAEALDVSATPVREALQILRAQGFVELAPRRGFTVASLSQQDIIDVFRARALISGELAALASERITEDVIDDLEALHEVLIRAFRAGLHSHVEAEVRQFHGMISDAAGSSRLRWSLDMLSRYVPRNFFAHLEGDEEMTDSDHREILDALRRRDAVGARAAMERHVENSGRTLAEYLTRREPRSERRPEGATPSTNRG